jgi:hypothetical protein
MSDVGSLSYEYKRAEELANELQKALTVVDRPEGGRLPPNMRLTTALELNRLIAVLDPINAQHFDGGAALRMPTSLVRRLQEHGIAGRSAVEALQELADHLSNQRHELNEHDIATLREVTATAKREASKTFQRMVRR